MKIRIKCAEMVFLKRYSCEDVVHCNHIITYTLHTTCSHLTHLCSLLIGQLYVTRQPVGHVIIQLTHHWIEVYNGWVWQTLHLQMTCGNTFNMISLNHYLYFIYFGSVRVCACVRSCACMRSHGNRGNQSPDKQAVPWQPG